MNDYIYQRNGMKKHCFSLFFVMKKNEKQCFINLITRRSSVQIWLAWMLCKKPWIIPIPGTRNPERMQENANAADVELSSAEVEKIDAMLDKIPMSAVYGGVATRGNA